MKFLKNYSDCLALGFFVTAILVVFLFEMIVIRPYLYENNYSWIPLHLSAACFLVLNLYVNLYNLYTIDTSTLKLQLPSNLLPGWHYCYSCEANSPPRAYHCNICDRCILRRDHHCIFSASCIGYKNYKYYVSLLFQTSFACIYASILHSGYIWSNMGGLNPLTFFSHCLPVPFFMFGFIDKWTLFCNLISVLCIVGFLFGTGLFIYHVNLLLKNQTTYEKHRTIQVYNLKNWSANLTETLGPSWLFTVFVSPLIDSPLPGNGVYYPTLDEHKYSR